ncbi:MAG: hypothetical protein IPP85_14280 [Propionivibrio sp.]|nr:hypothetical protein [Propionivibrio sp.]
MISDGNQGLRQIAGAAVGRDLQHHAKAGRVEGDRIAERGRGGVDLRLAGQQAAVAVDHADLVFLGEPPGDLLLQQCVERINANQRTMEVPVFKERKEDLELG